MKIAIFSDIHANVLALRAVLEKVDQLGIKKIIIAGDFLGYYYRAKEVLDLIEQRDVVVCRGNHEDLFYQWCHASEIEKKRLKDRYGSGLQIAQHTLTDEQKAWVFSLSHPVFEQIGNKLFCIAHGAPWDINQYIYFDRIQTVENQFLSFANHADIVVLGHTHYQGTQNIGHLRIINPGSVGQPRSGKKQDKGQGLKVRAQWAVIDTIVDEVVLMTTYYSAALLLEEIGMYDPHHTYLKEVLYRVE